MKNIQWVTIIETHFVDTFNLYIAHLIIYVCFRVDKINQMLKLHVCEHSRDSIKLKNTSFLKSNK